MFDAISTALPPIKSGLVRALGVSSAQRSPDLPDVPTIAESGYPEYRVSVWYGIAAPAKLPDDIAAKIDGKPRPGFERRSVPRLAGKDRLSGLPSAQRRRDQGIHRCRPGTVVGA